MWTLLMLYKGYNLVEAIKVFPAFRTKCQHYMLLSTNYRTGLLHCLLDMYLNWGPMSIMSNVFFTVHIQSYIIYIPSTLNIDLTLWHTQLIVCAVKC